MSQATHLVEDIVPMREPENMRPLAESTRFDELVPMPGEANEGYYHALTALHKQRRDFLMLKRLGDPAYSQEQYDELRRYIDDFQRTIEHLENRRADAVVARIEALANELITSLHGRHSP